MNIKALAASALVATTAFFTGVGDAKASYCYDLKNGGHTCIHRVRGNYNGTRKTVWWSHNGGEMRVVDVTCNPAFRYNYVENVAGIACFEYN